MNFGFTAFSARIPSPPRLSDPRGVDADRVVRDVDNADPVPRLQHTQLLETLCLLEGEAAAPRRGKGTPPYP